MCTPPNTCFLWPTRVHNQNGTSISSACPFPYKLPIDMGRSRLPPNTCFPGPTGVHNPNGISIGSAIFAQLIAECRRTYPGVSYSRLRMGRSGDPSNTWFLGPNRVQIPNGISIGSAMYAQLTADCRYTLQWDAYSPQKIYPFPWGDLDPHLIHGSQAYQSPQPKRQLDRCSRFYRAH